MWKLEGQDVFDSDEQCTTNWFNILVFYVLVN
jgi:hypothetical protein